MKQLIVTADDFGASPAVNEAVERAHRQGYLSAASLMVTGDAVDDAVARARTMPSLGVGLHLVLVEGKPALPSAQVSGLIDDSGHFRRDMVGAAIAMTVLPKVRRQLHAEIEAQFAAFAATGLRLDHVNTHKHFHLHPVIASAMLKAARRYGVTGARAPVEPRAILAAIEPGRRLHHDPAAFWAKLTRHRLRRAGMIVPDQVFGLAWSGRMTAVRMRGLLERLPDGLTEIYLHPATTPYPGSAPGYDYAGELAALIDGPARSIARGDGLRLGSFADFQGSAA